MFLKKTPLSFKISFSTKKVPCSDVLLFYTIHIHCRPQTGSSMVRYEMLIISVSDILPDLPSLPLNQTVTRGSLLLS